MIRITAGNINFAKQITYYDQQMEQYISSLGIPPGPPHLKGIYGSPEYTGKAYPDFGTPLNKDNEPPLGWPKVPVFNKPGDVPGPPVQWGDDITNDNVEAGWGYDGTGVLEETDRFFYHPDHLGSTAYVTTAKGRISQHIEYIPFGEMLIEEHTNSWQTPYKFNAKEFDSETGLGYFSARYYDPKISVWLSVDPLAEAAPGWSPYNYTLQNPVNFIDPDGRSANPIYDENGNFLGTDDKGLQGEAIIMNKDDFSQSMSHTTAMAKGTLLSNYNVESDGKGGLTESGKYQAAVFDRINMHSLGLSKRPDYNGKLTLSEVNEWYRNGNGQPLFVDAAKIDLSPVKVDYFNTESQYKTKNFFLTTNTETGLVYGTIGLTLINANTGSVRLGNSNTMLLDIYDFDHKSYDGTIDRAARNIGTWIGNKVAGKGIPFKIYNYGYGKVKK